MARGNTVRDKCSVYGLKSGHVLEKCQVVYPELVTSDDDRKARFQKRYKAWKAKIARPRPPASQ